MPDSITCDSQSELQEVVKLLADGEAVGFAKLGRVMAASSKSWEDIVEEVKQLRNAI